MRFKTHFNKSFASTESVSSEPESLDFSSFLGDKSFASSSSSDLQITYDGTKASRGEEGGEAVDLFSASTPKRSLVQPDSASKGGGKRVKFAEDSNEEQRKIIEKLREENKRITGLYNRVLREKSCDQLCAKQEILIGVMREKFKTMALISKEDVEKWKSEREEMEGVKAELKGTKALLNRMEGELAEVLANK